MSTWPHPSFAFLSELIQNVSMLGTITRENMLTKCISIAQCIRALKGEDNKRVMSARNVILLRGTPLNVPSSPSGSLVRFHHKH